MVQQTVILIDQPPEGHCFMVTQYDETMKMRPGFIDMRDVFRRFEAEWLGDLYQSHMELSSLLANGFSNWWLGLPTRLDLRPMAYEGLFSPYFMARTIVEWLQEHPEIEELYVVDDTSSLKDCFPELGQRLTIADRRRTFTHDKETSLSVDRNWTRVAFKENLKILARLVLRHVMRKHPSPIKSKSVVALANIFGIPLQKTLEYFFTDLLKEVPDDGMAVIMTGVSENRPAREFEIEGHQTVFLLDFLNVSDVIKAFVQEIRAQFLLKKIQGSPVNGNIGDLSYPSLWNDYYRRFQGNSLVFVNVAAFYAAKTMAAKNEIEKVVFPYEEKPVERALIYGTRHKKSRCKSEIWGFLVHPQARTFLMLQQDSTDQCVKPDKLAFCGTGYVAFMESLGFDVSRKHVWGSRKGWRGTFPALRPKRSEAEFRLLVTLNNSNELKILRSWIQSEPRLRKGSLSIQLRKYWANTDLEFNSLTKELSDEFENVSTISDTLEQNVGQADAVLFCVTSAGIEAVNHGRPGIYGDLSNLFSQDILQGNMQKWPCAFTAKHLADHIDELSNLSEDRLVALMAKQKELAAEVFSSANRSRVTMDVVSKG